VRPSATFTDTITFLRTVRHYADRRVCVSVLLMVVLGAVEIGGLVLLLPLLQLGGIEVAGSGSSSLHTWIDSLRQSGFAPGLPILLAVFLVLTLVQAFGKTRLARLTSEIQVGFTRFLRERLHRALVRAEWSAFLLQRSSNVLTTLTAETQAAGSGVNSLITIITAVVQAVCQLALALLISPLVTSVALLSAGGMTWAVHRLNLRVRREGRAGLSERQALAANLTDHLAGLKVAKSHGSEAHGARIFEQLSASLGDRQIRMAVEQARSRAWLAIGTSLALCGLLWFVIEGRAVRGAELALLGVVYLRLVSRLMAVQTGMQRLALVLPSFAATETLLAQLTAAAPAPLPEPPGRRPLQHTLRFEHVSFRYPASTDYALADLTLEIPAGQTIALCGPSGAGKSTVADLALGLLRPSAGRVLLDGQPLDDATIPHWRVSIAYVPQEVFLFDATVRENLLSLQRDADEPALWAALEQASAAELVRSLPQGLDTWVGERGVRLSGGERQRLALARALLRQPALLVLDEATSSLDHAHEHEIRRAVEQLRGTRTILIIAHRLSSIRHADHIVLLESGRIVQAGSWHNLQTEADSPFARFVAAAGI
jgi:ATP-binding cassette subfamily C protein